MLTQKWRLEFTHIFIFWVWLVFSNHLSGLNSRFEFFWLIGRLIRLLYLTLWSIISRFGLCWFGGVDRQDRLRPFRFPGSTFWSWGGCCCTSWRSFRCILICSPCLILGWCLRHKCSVQKEIRTRNEKKKRIMTINENNLIQIIVDGV